MKQELDDNEENPYVLWAEIVRLRAAVQGPDGYETWQKAAVAEKLKRQEAQRQLEHYKGLLARSRLDLMRELKQQGWIHPDPRLGYIV